MIQVDLPGLQRCAALDLCCPRGVRARAPTAHIVLMMMAAVVITPRRASTRQHGHDTATPNPPVVTSF